VKALVAEDDPDIQLILRMILTRMGKCEVVVTDSGTEVLLQAKNTPPDFILLDVMLPEMSGYDICKALKADDATRQIPIIFLTARSMPTEIKEALSLGALGYLAKPFDPMTLVAQINEFLTPVGCAIGGD
jgi:two-component system, OmpR family, response regulator